MGPPLNAETVGGPGKNALLPPPLSGPGLASDHLTHNRHNFYTYYTDCCHLSVPVL